MNTINNKIFLNNVTLYCVDTRNPEMAVEALKKSCENIIFSKVIFFSDKKPHNFDDKFEFKKINKFNNLLDYSKFIMNKLCDYIDTDFCISVQADGYIINFKNWDNNFLKYDYIGAPWTGKEHFTTPNTRVGNGGVSLRSKKLLLETKNLVCDRNEDDEICQRYRNFLISKGLTFAPIELAYKFSVEQICDDLDNNYENNCFAFHGEKYSNFHKENIEKLENNYYNNMFKNLTLISASYNTPEITEYMLKTFTNLYNDCKILICDNSTDDKTETLLKNNNIPYIRNKNGLHSPSVDLLLDSIETDYALLVDTDVLFLKDIRNVYKVFVESNITLMGEIVGDRGGKKLHKRVNPWHCFINVKTVKENKLKFHDEKRLKSRDEIRYDVGASFFEDIRNLKLKIADFNGENIYYRHFEGMSWRINKYKKNGIDGDIDNNINDTHNSEGLYQYGLHVYNLFLKEKEKYNNLKINYNLA